MSAATSENKNWAVEHLIDPLNEPTPAEETGLGTSFRPVQANLTGSSTNPFRRKSVNSTTSTARSRPKSQDSSIARIRDLSIDSTTSSSSMRKFPDLQHGSKSASHSRNASTGSRTSLKVPGETRPRRSSSLRERYPGDMSVHPLATITNEQKLANRSPHLRKKHHQGADSIDKLDNSWLNNPYHHESAYDAASLARNNSFGSGPIAALESTNLQALKATPREKVKDSIIKHRPLDGTASFPPGQHDAFGRVYHYRETNLMVEDGGDYKRWPGVDYLPEDVKGKGEPSYTIEKQLKDHAARTKAQPVHNGEYELEEQRRKPRIKHNNVDAQEKAPLITGIELPSSSTTTTRNNADRKRR